MIKPWVRVAAAVAALLVVTSMLVGFVYADSIVSLVIGNENLVYYWSPTELQAQGDRAIGATARLGGMVKAGTTEDWDKKLPLRFFVTDGTNTVPVEATGAPPAMFREGIGVVLEGKLHEDGTFHAGRVMVKHSNEYRVPEDPQHPGNAASLVEDGT